MASVDNNGKVSDVDLIQDTNSAIDAEVDMLLSRKGMIVVEG